MIDNMRRSWAVGFGLLVLVLLGVATQQGAVIFTLLALWCWLGTCWLLSLKGSVSK